MNALNPTFGSEPVGDKRPTGGKLGTLDVPLPKRLALIVMRRRWIIIGAVVAALVLGLVITVLMTPKYTATTRIEISRESNRVTDIQGVERESSAVDQEFYQTQYGLLRSESLAEDVARKLRAVDDLTFFTKFGFDPEKLFGDQAEQRSPAARQRRLKAAGEILLDNLTVAPIRNSRLVDISIRSPDPVFSAALANAWAQSFIETNIARRFSATTYARNFLERRLAELRQRLEESERTLVGYAENQNIVNIPGIPGVAASAGGERSLVADELSRLNAELADATADRIKTGARLGTGDGANPLALSNVAIANLRSKRAELAAQYAEMLVKFKPDYPPAAALQTQIGTLDTAIRREEGRVASSFSADYDNARKREARLQTEVNNLKGDVTNLRRRSIQYTIFQREVDTNRQLYDGLLQRYKEIGVAGGIGTSNVLIVDGADAPDRPSSPNLKLNLFLALIFGLALGGAAAWIMEQVEEGISDPTDVPSQLQLPLLGTVPVSTEAPLEALANPRSEIVDAYLAIQTNLSLSTEKGIPRSLAVTSTRPREGKSTSSYALAHSLVRTGRKVVLIDGDMRSPMVHNEFGLSNAAGLSNFLSGADDVAALIQKAPNANLAVITAGPTPPNAADLLTTDRLRQLIARLLETFDNVVVDAPPVMGLADAPLIASAVEGTVYVVQSRVVRSSLIRLALHRLNAAHANIIGVVLSKFETKHSRFGFGYDYGYGYGRDKTDTSA